MKSASLSIQTLVIPDLIRDKAFLGGLLTAGDVAKGSWTPDQVRGDEAGGDDGMICSLALHNTVTLNSFQGPSPGLRQSTVGKLRLSVARSTRASGYAARWMLNQVQHDEFVREAAE